MNIKDFLKRLFNLPEVDENGTKRWYNKNRQLHRDDDKPSVIYADGRKEWWKNGQLHRDGDKPAIIFANGEEEYYNNGVQYEPHR